MPNANRVDTQTTNVKNDKSHEERPNRGASLQVVAFKDVAMSKRPSYGQRTSLAISKLYRPAANRRLRGITGCFLAAFNLAPGCRREALGKAGHEAFWASQAKWPI